jgi:hypothetical protein
MLQTCLRHGWRRRSNAFTYRPFLEPFEDRLLPSTYAVINTADTGQGSLRQALLDANANSGPNTIIFDIRGEGGHTIQPRSPLPTITRAVTIDGTYQPGYNGSPLIELDGEFAGTGVNGLTIDTPSGATMVKGLDIDRYSGGGIRVQNGTTSTSVAIQGDYLGTDITGTAGLGNSIGVDVFGYNGAITIGGPTDDAFNVISGNVQNGIKLSLARTSVIQNNLIGTDFNATHALANGGGMLIAASFPQISDNIISGNSGYGILIGQAQATIQRNWIGIDATGTQALPNVTGILISPDGQATLSSNVISGNFGDGITIDGAHNTVQDNFIGTDISGTQPIGNGRNGVQVVGSAPPYNGFNTITNNVIAFNGNDGVLVNRSYSNPIRSNSIFGNGNRGIELVNDGNENQPAPALTAAVFDGYINILTIYGTVTGAPNTTLTLDFFASDADGDGQYYIGSMSVDIGPDGVAGFGVAFSAILSQGQFITATSTGSGGTSSFSYGFQIGGQNGK